MMQRNDTGDDRTLTVSDKQPTYESIHVNVSYMSTSRTDADQLQTGERPRGRSLRC